MNAVSESKPMAIMMGRNMAKNGRVSSAMPKVEPPRANRSMAMGITRMSLLLNLLTTRRMPASMAPVAVMIWNAPPTMNTKATTSAAAMMPAMGASSTAPGPWRRSTCLPVSPSTNVLSICS